MKSTHRIIKGDCLELIKKIPDHYIDFICADFPYNISNNGWLTMQGNKIVKADFGEWDKFSSMDKYLHFVYQNVMEYKRILKPDASMVLFFSYQYAGWIAYALERKNLFTFYQPIIFNKLNPLPSFKENNFRSCYEIGVRLVNDWGHLNRPKTFNFLHQSRMKSVLNYKIGKDGNKQSRHPTEKPESLIGELVEVFTRPWDVVLDNFAGSGTTGIACYKRGRHCISLEQSETFIKMIKERQARAERLINNRGA